MHFEVIFQARGEPKSLLASFFDTDVGTFFDVGKLQDSKKVKCFGHNLHEIIDFCKFVNFWKFMKMFCDHQIQKGLIFMTKYFFSKQILNEHRLPNENRGLGEH